MKHILKVISIFVVAIMLISLLSGCIQSVSENSKTTQATESASKQEETTKPLEKQEEVKKEELQACDLKYVVFAANDKVQFDAAIEDWNKKYPQIKVECILYSGSEGRNAAKAALAAGEQIDVIVHDPSYSSDLQEKVYLDLSQFISVEEHKKLFGKYSPYSIKDGKVISLINWIAPAGVFYNEEHFKEAGIPVPNGDEWTWDDFFDIAKQLTIFDENGKTVRWGGIHWQRGEFFIYDIALTLGWDIVTEDGRPNINDPKLKKALEYYIRSTQIDKSGRTDADIASDNIANSYIFTGERASMCIMGINNAVWMDWYVENGYMSKELDDKDVIKLTFMPRADKNSLRRPQPATIGGICVTKISKYPREAFEFAMYTCTDMVMVGAKYMHRYPAWTGADINQLIEDFRWQTDTEGKLFLGKDRPELYKASLEKDVNFIFWPYRNNYAYSPQLLDELKKELSLLIAGEKPIDRVLEDAQAAAEKVYEKFKN